MRILLDENVPEPLISPLGWLLRDYEIMHGKRFKGIKDQQLYAKAKRSGYELIVTADINQLLDPEICKAIHRSGLHGVFFETGHSRLDDLVAAAGALIHCMRGIISALGKEEGQRIVVIPILSGHGSYKVYDPKREPPSHMWPRKQHGEHKPSRNPKR